MLGAQAEQHQDREGQSWPPGWGEVGEQVLIQADSPSGEVEAIHTEDEGIGPCPSSVFFILFF